jgi:hypothetical protein
VLSLDRSILIESHAFELPVRLITVVSVPFWAPGPTWVTPLLCFGGERILLQKNKDLVFAEWIVLQLRHGEVLAVVGHQDAVALQCDGCDDSVCDGKRTALPCPMALESSGELSCGSG